MPALSFSYLYFYAVKFRTFFIACISIHWYDLHTEKHLPLVLLILGLPSSFLLCFNCFINQRLLPDNNIDYYAIGGWGMSVHGAATVIQLLPSSYSLASSLRTYNESWCNRELRTLIARFYFWRSLLHWQRSSTLTRDDTAFAADFDHTISVKF